MKLNDVTIIGGGPAGLFAAILLRRRFPDTRVIVYERTVPDDTFGFGVGFTRRTLDRLEEAAPAVVAAIRTLAVESQPQEIRVDGRSAYGAGNLGGIAVSRSSLLHSLLDTAAAVGVDVRLGTEVGLADIAGADLVIAADGVSSGVRAQHSDEFGEHVSFGRGRFMWLGCDRSLDTNLFAPVRTAHGLFNVHCYSYAPDRSTIGVETDEATWRRAGMDAFTDETPADESDERSVAYLQDVFGPVLGGSTLLANRSRWMQFRTVRVDRWTHDNIVLIGDAAHTAHYSVGSGTKMAMEDSAELIASLHRHRFAPLRTAVQAWEAQRRPRVERLQDLADRSRWWWESLETRLDLPVDVLMLAYLSRGGAVSTAQMATADPALVERALQSLGPNGQAAATDVAGRVTATPFTIAGRQLPTRRLQEAQGGILHETRVEIADPWGAESDAVLASLREDVQAQTRGILLTGDHARAHVLDRLALAERVRHELAVPVAVGVPTAYINDAIDGLVAGRVDLYRVEETLSGPEPSPRNQEHNMTSAEPAKIDQLSGVVPFPDDRKTQYQNAGLWQDRTISMAFNEIAEAHPYRLALATADANWSYLELRRRSDNVAAGLLRCGLEPGQRVILQLANTAHAISAWYGILRAGLVPICTLALHREHEISQIAAKTKAAVHLIQADHPGYDLVTLARMMADVVPSLRAVFTVGDSGGRSDAPRIEDLENASASTSELDALDAIARRADLDAPAVLQLSGGITGTPKVIPRLHPEYWYNGSACAQWWDLGPQDRLAFGLPISHNAGVANALIAAHSVGAALLLGTPQVDGFLSLMTEHHATWMMCATGLMRGYLEDPRFDAAIEALRFAVLAGSAPAQTLTDAMQARGLRIHQAFGMSEGLFMFTPADGSEELRTTTVGTPISPLDEVRLLEPHSEHPVPDGEVGELCARGPYTIRGFLDEPQRNAETFTSDGFYRSGDLARRLRIGNEVGYQMRGRIKDVISRGGEKINAEEIEVLLAQHPDIAEAALVAMPDQRLGERACAFVVVAPSAAPPTVSSVAQFMSDRGVAKYKWPERIEVIDALPRTKVGKLHKLALRERASELVRSETGADPTKPSTTIGDR